MGYQRSALEGVIAEIVDGILGGVLIMILVVVVAAVVTALLVILKELVAIYLRRAGQGTEAARILWIALAVFLVILLCSGLLATSPVTAGLGMMLASWGFLGLVVVTEGCEWWAQRHDQNRLKDAENLDSYLSDASWTDPGSNGHLPRAAAQ
jgi:hypothetical protein